MSDFPFVDWFKVDPYILGHELLRLDLGSVSSDELAILEHVCTEMLKSVNEEFEKREYEGD